MAIKFNKAGYNQALAMIEKGLEVENDQGNWNDVKPTVDEDLHYYETHDINEYGLWFLGEDTEADKDSSDRFVYPYGDFKVVHKSALIESEKKAKHSGDAEIAGAARKLIEKIK